MTSFEIQYLATQYGMLLGQAVLIGITFYFYRQLVANDNQRENRAIEAEIKHWCKAVFRTIDSPGALQRAGKTARERFGDRMNLILLAYDELHVEEPNSRRPDVVKFLEDMNAFEPEMWPSAADVWTGKLEFYR